MRGDQFREEESPPRDDGWWASVLSEENGWKLPSSAAVKKGMTKEASLGPRPTQAQKHSYKTDWERAQSLFQQDQIIEMTVTGYNRGGLLVEGDGLRGFVPCSHLMDIPVQPVIDAEKREKFLISFIGRTLRLKVIECEPKDGRIVFSERAARVEAGKRMELFKSLQAGHCMTGEVTNITDFGAFVDLGGVEGLVHISEISWGRVNHPGEVLRVGQRVEVAVMDVSPERCRVALSIKRTQPNPWELIERRYAINEIVPAVVTTVVQFGAFARLEDGLEGLIHASEISVPPNSDISAVLAPGQEIRVRILQMDAARQRLGLSLRLED